MTRTAIAAGLVVFRRDLLRAPSGTWWHLIALGVFGVGMFYAALATGVH